MGMNVSRDDIKKISDYMKDNDLKQIGGHYTRKDGGRNYPPEEMSAATGVDAEKIRLIGALHLEKKGEWILSTLDIEKAYDSIKQVKKTEVENVEILTINDEGIVTGTITAPKTFTFEKFSITLTKGYEVEIDSEGNLTAINELGGYTYNKQEPGVVIEFFNGLKYVLEKSIYSLSKPVRPDHSIGKDWLIYTMGTVNLYLNGEQVNTFNSLGIILPME